MAARWLLVWPSDTVKCCLTPLRDTPMNIPRQGSNKRWDEKKEGRKCLAAKGEMTDERHEMLHSDRHRDCWFWLLKGISSRDINQDGTYIPQALSACGWQHVYNKTWAKPLLYISVTDQLYSHVTLITVFCRSAVPQHQASVSLQCVSAVVFIGIKKKKSNLQSAKAKQP